MIPFALIRFFGLFLMALYVYIKILQIPYRAKRTQAKKKSNFNEAMNARWKPKYTANRTLIEQSLYRFCLLAVIVSFVVSWGLSYVPPLYELWFVGSVFVFVFFTLRNDWWLMITGVVLSIGIVVGVDFLGIYVVMFLVSLWEFLIQLLQALRDTMSWHALVFQFTFDMDWNITVQLFSTMIDVLIVFFFFRQKRLKRGFTFLQRKEGCWIGLIISILIMFTRSCLGYILVNICNVYDIVDMDVVIIISFYFFIIGAFILIVHLWWRDNTTIRYQQLATERTNQENLVQMAEKDAQIKKLMECNAILGKMIHKDNKFVPAMYHAVTQLLTDEPNEAYATKAQQIRYELDEMMKERKGILFETPNKKQLPRTGIPQVDTLMEYMYNDATNKGILFEFLLGDISQLPKEAISDTQLRTLLADLIENAIIAVATCREKKMKVFMGTIEGFYEMHIQDSGVPFEEDVLKKLGKQNVTTHENEGGSGIGYMTIHEILNACGASLSIEAHEPPNNGFTKTIKVLFNVSST